MTVSNISVERHLLPVSVRYMRYGLIHFVQCFPAAGGRRSRLRIKAPLALEK